MYVLASIIYRILKAKIKSQCSKTEKRKPALKVEPTRL